MGASSARIGIICYFLLNPRSMVDGKVPFKVHRGSTDDASSRLSKSSVAPLKCTCSC